MRDTMTATAASSGDLRAAMRLFPTGVALLTTGRGNRAVGMTINSLMSVSLALPLVLVSVHHDARARAVLKSTGEFTISLLSVDQEDLARLFASRDKPSGHEVAARSTGALCSLACSVQAVYPGGDHDLFLGRVLDVGFGDVNREPLLFYQGRLRGPGPLLSTPQEVRHV